MLMHRQGSLEIRFGLFIKDNIMIEHEIASFERMQAELSRRYGSQYVAIYQGNVVAHGPDKHM